MKRSAVSLESVLFLLWARFLLESILGFRRVSTRVDSPDSVDTDRVVLNDWFWDDLEPVVSAKELTLEDVRSWLLSFVLDLFKFPVLPTGRSIPEELSKLSPLQLRESKRVSLPVELPKWPPPSSRESRSHSLCVSKRSTRRSGPPLATLLSGALIVPPSWPMRLGSPPTARGLLQKTHWDLPGFTSCFPEQYVQVHEEFDWWGKCFREASEDSLRSRSSLSAASCSAAAASAFAIKRASNSFSLAASSLAASLAAASAAALAFSSARFFFSAFLIGSSLQKMHLRKFGLYFCFPLQNSQSHHSFAFAPWGV
mmetsp:Transcript_50163/g.113836  ORF Transcript_50163/g.113836 Transcript_50163/m.113836 type:complete len:312 (-) Transcript_50163:177-1112(-)